MQRSDLSPLSRIIVDLAIRLSTSTRYKRYKRTVYDLLENPDYPYKKYLDLVMIFLIVSSVAILVYEVRHTVAAWLDLYDIYFVSFIFFIEYIARLWVHDDMHREILSEYEQSKFLNKPFSLRVPLIEIAKKKLAYMATPAMIVDLLAILPAYRPLRILRIFILFRVFKLLRYTRSIKQFVDVVKSKRFELITLLFLLFFIVVTAGIAIYVFEEDKNPQINSLFDALYWAIVTISTVGYGDIAPVTPQGRAVSVLIIISGIAMISFVTSVIVSAFSEKLHELKEHRIVEEIRKNDTFLIICGYGQLSKMFLRQKPQEKYLVIDKDRERVEEALREGYRAICDDASRHEVMARFFVPHARVTVLALTPNDVENTYIALTAKSLSREAVVIARASDETMERKLRLAGADHVLLPNQVTSRMLLTAITKPVMYHGLHALLTGHNVAYIDELHLKRMPLLHGKSVADVDFASFKLLLIGVQRGGLNGTFLFNPKKTLRFEEEDVLVVMGLKISVAYFARYFSGVHYA